MTQSEVTLVALGVAVLIAFALMILVVKKVIKKETVEGIADVIRDMPVTMGSGLFGKIWEYSRAAVLTVEQLVKTEQIAPDDETRKDKAMKLVEAAAEVDGVPYGQQEREVASACIEAEVHELPRNKTKAAT